MMSRSINLGVAESGENVYIDIPTLVATRLLVTASSGGGKSETLRRILEEAVGSIQCIVIDPEGEFSTLREQKPFVLVGEGGETPADIRTASLVATRLLELNASAVCDIYEMRVQDRHEWVKRFLDSIVHSPKSLWHPVLIVLDEAHTYCPEHGYGESVASQSVIDLANLGRKRGFCAILATQRLSKLSKNAAEPLQNYLVGRTTFDDQKRAAQTFKIDPGAETRKFSLELERLRDGQFISRGRAITGDMLKVQVTRGITRPPATGTSMAGVVTPTPAAIRALLPKLADLPREAEKKIKTEADLQKELQDAKRRVVELEKAKPADQSPIVASLRGRIAELESYSSSLAKVVDKARSTVTGIQKLCDTFNPPMLVVENSKMVETIKMSALKLKPESEWPKPTQPKAHITDDTLSGPERRIINAIAWFESLGIEQPHQPAVAFLAGYTFGGGAFNNPRGRLKVNGFLNYVGERIELTDEGRKRAEYPDTAATRDELHQKVLSILPGPEQRLLRPLLDSYPSPLSNQELADAAQYTNGAGAFNNPRGRLKTLGLIEYPQPGMVKARDLLFP